MVNEDEEALKPRKFRKLCETPEAMAAFRSEYGIPNNVGVELAPLDADRETSSWDRMLIPIVAIADGRSSFPPSPIAPPSPKLVPTYTHASFH